MTALGPEWNKYIETFRAVEPSRSQLIEAAQALRTKTLKMAAEAASLLGSHQAFAYFDLKLWLTRIIVQPSDQQLDVYNTYGYPLMRSNECGYMLTTSGLILYCESYRQLDRCAVVALTPDIHRAWAVGVYCDGFFRMDPLRAVEHDESLIQSMANRLGEEGFFG